MHPFSRPVLDSEDIDRIIIQWIEDNSGQFYSDPITHDEKRRRMRVSKTDYWDTNWGRMLKELESAEED